MRSLESEILAESRTLFNRRTLRLKDILEWSTAPIKPRSGEVVARLDVLRVYVCIAEAHDKRTKSKTTFVEAKEQRSSEEVVLEHSSGLSGEHDVVLDAIQAECLGG